jgi:hypothetical protein
MRTAKMFFLLAVALGCACWPASAAPPPDSDLACLEGKWSINEGADPEQYLLVSHERKDGRIVGSVMRLKIGGEQGHLDYIGAVCFEATGANPRITLHPVVAAAAGLPEKMEYRVDGDRVLLWITEGKHQGGSKFLRAKKQ